MPNYPKLGRKSTSNEMGAIGQPASGRNHAGIQIKSASVESNNLPQIICCSSIYTDQGINNSNAYSANSDAISVGESNHDVASGKRAASQDSLACHQMAQEETEASVGESRTKTKGPSQHRGFLSPFGGYFSPLRPSVSTSCLFTTSNDETQSPKTAPSTPDTMRDDELQAKSNQSSASASSCSNTSLVCVPTRASLTHGWRKLKTPNKCRECNLLVYFNGRECSSCGFVAHKKCIMVLVIKCSGQRLLSQQDKQNGGGGGGASFSMINQNFHLAGGGPLGGGGDTGSDKKNKRSLLAHTKWVSSPSYCTVCPIFGQAIADIEAEQVLDFINRFVYEIDTRGLTSKGIYRVSSIKSKVDKLCNYFDKNLSSLIDLSSFHPNIIANALKMYLRRLPEPLLTNELYPDLIDIAKKYSATVATTKKSPEQSSTSSSSSSSLSLPAVYNRKATMEKQARQQLQLQQQHGTINFMSYDDDHHHRLLTSINGAIGACGVEYDSMLITDLKQIVRLLPPINHQIVAIIMRHLRRVADMAEENQMSAKNLSIIFGPTLLSAANNKSLAIVDNIHQARVVELMITWAYQIFPNQ